MNIFTLDRYKKIFSVHMMVFLLSFFSNIHVQAKPEPIEHHTVNKAQGKASLMADNVNPNSRLGLLEAANKELLTKNASLEQENNKLLTQVNVLAAERSNQIFMTGAFVATGGIFLGFIVAWLLLGRRQNEW